MTKIIELKNSQINSRLSRLLNIILEENIVNFQNKKIIDYKKLKKEASQIYFDEIKKLKKKKAKRNKKEVLIF